MFRLAALRTVICLLGGVIVVSALAYAVWRYGESPGNVPPPLPDLEIAQEPRTQPRPAEPALAEEEREFLWQAEHYGNLLNVHGFKKLADALRDANADAMSALLREDFSGELRNQPKEIRPARLCCLEARHRDPREGRKGRQSPPIGQRDR